MVLSSPEYISQRHLYTSVALETVSSWLGATCLWAVVWGLPYRFLPGLWVGGLTQARVLRTAHMIPNKWSGQLIWTSDKTENDSPTQLETSLGVRAFWPQAFHQTPSLSLTHSISWILYFRLFTLGYINYSNATKYSSEWLIYFPCDGPQPVAPSKGSMKNIREASSQKALAGVNHERSQG